MSFLNKEEHSKNYREQETTMTCWRLFLRQSYSLLLWQTSKAMNTCDSLQWVVVDDVKQ